MTHLIINLWSVYKYYFSFRSRPSRHVLFASCPWNLALALPSSRLVCLLQRVMAMATPFTLGISIVIVTTGILTWLYYRRQQKRSPRNLQLLTDPNVKHELQLIERVQLSHNTRRFRFQLPPATSLGLKPGQHIYLSALLNGSVVVRTYSPVSTNWDVGYMDLIIKVYVIAFCDSKVHKFHYKWTVLQAFWMQMCVILSL